MFTLWRASLDYVIIIEFMSKTSLLLFILSMHYKNVTWTWSEEAQKAFNTFKEKLLEFPILRRPEFNKVFILRTN
jgi:hypothetical protein